MKKYTVDLDPLTGKNDGKAIKKLNTMQHMHEGLNHQDVVRLEQEYADKSAQFSEQQQQVSKIPKVDSQNNAVAEAGAANIGANAVPTNPLNNDLPTVNGVTDVTSNNEVDQFVGMYPSALDHLMPKMNKTYAHYRVFRKRTKYEYRTVQYELFGPEFIAALFTEAIRTRDGMHEYPVYFRKQMMVLEYREQRRENEDALVESTRSKPRTFLAFYKKWKRHQQYKPDMRKYQSELYGKYQPWMTFEQIVTRNEINRENGFLNIKNLCFLISVFN